MIKSSMREWWIGIALLAVTTFCVALNFGNLFFHPDSALMDANGDAIKNYYAFAWHVKHDAHWLEFNGSNFPYGEHVGYTDGHPLFSLIFGHFDWVKNNPIGFINAWVIYSHLLTVLILYLFFLRIKINPWLAAFGAFSIEWLNPQVFRMTGHLSLSYSWMIPLYFLFLLRAIEKNKWVLISIYSVALFFIHPYVGMGISLFSGLYIGYHFWQNRKTHRNYLSVFSSLGLAFILPPAFYAIFTKVTDHHLNRPEAAKGFLEYTSNPGSVFLPHHGPIHNVLPESITSLNSHWEGWSYIGVAASLLWLTMIILRLTKIFKWEFPNWLKALLWSSSLLLFFSFGWPFKWNLQILLEKIPFIQQFRSPGRFSWFFYFAATIGAVYLLSQLLLWKKNVAYVFAVLFFSFTIWEGQAAFQAIKPRLGAESNYFNTQHLSAEWQSDVASIKKDSTIQAIVPIPFFHYGSDFFAYQTNESTKQKAYIIAYHSGKPLVASANPRVSLTESREQLALFNIEHYWPVNRMDEVWAVLQDERTIQEASPLEKYLVENSTPSTSNRVGKLSAKNWYTIENRESVIHEMVNDTLLTSSQNNWIHPFSLSKGNYDVFDSIPASLILPETTYFVEYEIECNQEEGIPHLLLIMQQKDEQGNGAWPSVVTMNRASGLPSNVYKGIFEVKGLLAHLPVQLIVHHNEPQPIDYQIRSWKLFRQKK